MISGPPGISACVPRLYADIEMGFGKMAEADQGVCVTRFELWLGPFPGSVVEGTGDGVPVFGGLVAWEFSKFPRSLFGVFMGVFVSLSVPAFGYWLC